VESATPTAWVPQSKPIWFTELGCPAIDRGTNQPNVFFDPKSSESFTPYFSRGWRDDAIQRAYLEATWLWWGDPANNPVSSVYGGRMVHVPECAAWTWDARPYPFFPALTDVWTDGANWRLGHWLTGRLGHVAWRRIVLHRDAHDLAPLELGWHLIGALSVCGRQRPYPIYRKAVGLVADHHLCIRVRRSTKPEVAGIAGRCLSNKSDLEGRRAGEVELRVVGRAAVRSHKVVHQLAPVRLEALATG
jgi:hypothetical protein